MMIWFTMLNKIFNTENELQTNSSLGVINAKNELKSSIVSLNTMSNAKNNVIEFQKATHVITH